MPDRLPGAAGGTRGQPGRAPGQPSGGRGQPSGGRGQPSGGRGQPSGGRGLRADAARNREKVLRAAREAFADSGFAVPLDEIAVRAGVGPGTIYRHFPNKEALFTAVVAARIEDLTQEARARAADADPGAAFFGFLSRLGEEAATKRDLPDAITLPGAMLADLHAAMNDLLSRAQAAGAVRPGVTVPELITVLKGVLAAIGEARDQGSGRELADRWLAILTDGLRPPPA